jgi:hypothetical protein
MQILYQGNGFGHVAEIRVLFHDLINPVAEARVLASHFFLRHGVPHAPRAPHI